MKKLLLLAFCCVSMVGFAQDSPGEYTVKNVRVNTDFSDFGTAFYGDNKIVFAAPKEGITFNREEYNSQPFLDLYIGEVTDDGQLIHKQKMPGDINTKFHEGMVSFSKDGKTVYFSANGKIKKVKKGKKGKSDEVKTKATINIQLFKATIDEEGNWGNLEMLPFNSDDFSTGHPVLNRDDTKLYFVSDRPGSIGKTDIYVVDVYPDGTYGEPMNLGPEINTPEREMFPFIGEDNVLYFSSDGYPGYGELDVYASKVFDNTVSAPMNLEEPVNSPMDDFAYIIDDTKNKGYFSSNREGGRGDDDIYSFTASPPIYIECQQEITGVVRNIDTQELIPNVKIMLFDEEGQKLKTFISKESDASFSFDQSCNTTYKIKGYLEGYLIGELDITTVNDLNAEPLEIVFHMEVDPSREVSPVASDSKTPTIMETLVADQDTLVAEEASEAVVEASEESEKSPTLMGALAGEEAGQAVVAVSEESEVADSGDAAEAVAVDATSFEEDQVEVTDAEGKDDSQKETFMSGETVATADETVVAEQATPAPDQATPANQQVTSMTQKPIEPLEESKNAPTLLGVLGGEEAGQAVVAASEESEVADSGDAAEARSVDATSFEEDRVAVTDAQGKKNQSEQEDFRSGEAIALAEKTEQKNGVQINEENGFNINTIYFDFDKYAIRADARIELDKLLIWLRENPDMKIEVNAHTDVRGSEKYNQKLSDKRANQTVSYLTDRGIDPMRISGKGFGESQVVERCTEAKPCNGLQHQLNRRSEFYLRDPETDAIVFRSRNRTPSLRDEKGMYASNSGMYMNYNFYADDQVYTVQVGAFKGKIQTDKYSKLKTLFNHRYDDGLNRYYSGTFESAEAARAHLKEMRAKGFTDAFVVKLEGEQRRL